MLGDMELSPAQLAQLRALGRRYAQRSFEGGSPEELRARLRADIREMLTPEQRETLARREAPGRRE